MYLLNIFIVYTEELPSVKYVISKNGLNQREAASSSSKKIGTLLYGSRIIVYEKSNSKDIINGITDFWYRCHSGGWYWVFGGYLSNIMPCDTDPVLGYWNTNRGERFYWNFWPDNTVSTGIKETSGDWRGTWKLIGNKLIINIIPNEFSIREGETIEINITIIDQDKLFFKYSDGKEEILVRNNSII